jgi:DNA-binding winged helix-turn-helix (wHTH) protein
VTYRFVGFSLDTGVRQLLKGGREVHLSPKAFELLVLLIEQRSRALSKAELQELLWPSTFVGETNLATLVAEIRRALDESAQDARTIRTIHRFGYRFVGAVEEAGTGDGGHRQPSTEMYLATLDRRYPLPEGTALIGRARDATIRVDSGGVSRHHARIVVAGDEATVEDLGSKNGTFVDGHPISGRCVLKDGGEIRIGPVVLTFRVASATRATETMIEGSVTRISRNPHTT